MPVCRYWNVSLFLISFQMLTKDLHAVPLLSWEMKRAFEQISLCCLSNCSVPMQIAEPFAMLFIMKPAVRIFVNQLMPVGILFIASYQESKQRSNDRFVMWPPEFHVLPVFLYRLII